MANEFSRICENRFQGCLSMQNDQIDDFANNIGTIFGQLIDYSDTISSIRFYPINFPDYYRGYLSTAKLDVGDSVIVNRLPPKSGYYNMGYLFIPRFYNDFRDYTNDTNISVFLPFCGFADLDPYYCVGKYLHFRLTIDFPTGKGMYSIFATEKLAFYDYVSTNDVYGFDPLNDIDKILLRTYDFELGIDIPLGSTNAGDVARNLALNAIKVAGSAALSLALKTPITSVSTTNTTKTYDIQGRGKYKNARMKQIKSGSENTESVRTTTRSVDNSNVAVNAFESSLNAINTNFHSSRGDRPNSSSVYRNLPRNVRITISYQKYVDMTYRNGNYVPDTAYRDQMAHIYGKPLSTVYNLSALRGYTKIGDIHIENEYDYSGKLQTATQYEIDTIISKLKAGVIL